MKKRLYIVLIILFYIQFLYSKRLEPEIIEPIQIGKDIYSIPHFTKNNIGGVLREENIETHKKYDHILYKVYRHQFIEGDSQDIFFKSMEYLEKENVLKLIDEKDRSYIFDLKTKRIKGFRGFIQKYGSIIIYFFIVFLLILFRRKNYIKSKIFGKNKISF